ncbi:hypothetical protein, partial [Burkholderia sp. SIMBA_062]|uniref:hypothetical protein n=1 Tax=Burkholderia sp. SIMBA_062 TaxID=3085803 RepID=UPI00397A4EB1
MQLTVGIVDAIALNLCRDPARARAAAAPRTIRATAAAGTPARRSSNPKAKSRMTDTSRANKDLVLITGASGF